MNNLNWDDLRYVLAVAQSGSLNAAATQLGVTHVTVLRRVAQFEAEVGTQVFLKKHSGYSVLPEAQGIVDAANQVSEAVWGVERAVVGSDTTVSGEVRIASTDSLSIEVLPAIVQEISCDYPQLSLTLYSANSHHDFVRHSADIAVRPTQRLDQGMVGDVCGTLGFAVYGRSERKENWLGLSGPLVGIGPAGWMEDHVSPDLIAARSDSFLVLRKLALEGLGQTVLPRFLGDSEKGLTRIDCAMPEYLTPIWVAVLSELSGNARFHIVRQDLAKRLGNRLKEMGL